MKYKNSKLYCFSPPVMMATFLIEIGLAAYVIVRYKMSKLTRLVFTLLVCLATFQAAEYFVCGGLGLNTETWSRIGYVAITLLPPLGLHAAHAIAGRSMGYVTALAYGSSALWAGLFAFNQSAFTGHVCGGNYVIFQWKPPLGALYFAYYYIWLFITMYLAVKYSKTAKPRIRKALTAQVMGYSAFIIPTSIINLWSPQTLSGIPSIMCGFAIIFAITLVVAIIPVEKERSVVLRQKVRS